MTRIAVALVLILCALPARAGFEEGKAALAAGDYLTAEQEFRPLAEKGHADAQLNLGLMYEMGWGVHRNLERAARWYRRAAEQGLHHAQDSLGSLYFRGERYADAMTWFLKAAEQGNASAQNTIGLIHSKGLGVPKNPVKAYMWYHISATTDPGGYGVVARKNIGIVSKAMTKAQIAVARARAWEWLTEHGKK